VAEVFDSDPGVWPQGYEHDISLLTCDDNLVEDVNSPVPDLGWLSRDGWNLLRQKPGNLKALGNVGGQMESSRTLKSADEPDFLVSSLQRA
jgi:hypothetical protein